MTPFWKTLPPTDTDYSEWLLPEFDEGITPNEEYNAWLRWCADPFTVWTRPGKDDAELFQSVSNPDWYILRRIGARDLVRVWYAREWDGEDFIIVPRILLGADPTPYFPSRRD